MPGQVKYTYLLDPEHHLSELIAKHLHSKLKHILVKQTLKELRQKYWLCSARSFVRKILSLFDNCAFHTTGIDHFGPVYVKLSFYSKSDSEPTLHKFYVIMLICASSWGVLLDVVPRLDASSFARNLKRFTSRSGCPTYIVSDDGKNFVFVKTRKFVSRLETEWKINLLLSPRQNIFFEILVRSIKILPGKELET